LKGHETGGDPQRGWRETDLAFIFKTGKKDNPEHYRLVSLTPSTYGKIMEEAICGHEKEEIVTGHSQLGIYQG